MWHQVFVVKSKSGCWPVSTHSPANALIELHYIALWGAHYSPRLICNERPSSTALKWTLTLISLWMKRKSCCLRTTHAPSPPFQHRPQFNPNYLFHKNIVLISRIGVACLFFYADDGRQQASVFTIRPCSYWLWSGDKYLSWGGDPSTLTGLLYHHPSQTLTNHSR